MTLWKCLVDRINNLIVTDDSLNLAPLTRYNFQSGQYFSYASTQDKCIQKLKLYFNNKEELITN